MNQLGDAFQLRVIRAFRSTLEDMEEKRSVHSIHSLRSTRSMLNRPMSDISYIDEETVLSAAARGQSFSGAGGSSSFNGGGLLAAPRHGMNASLRNKPSSGSEGSSSSSAAAAASRNNFLKVEGQTYRVCRTVGRQDSAANGGGGGITTLTVRRTSDAQTQSAESSFQEEAEPVQQQIAAVPAPAHPPQQQQSFDMSCATVNTNFPAMQAGSARMGTNNDDYAYAAAYVHVVGVPSSSRGPSPVLIGPTPVQYSMAGAGPTHLLPSPLFSAVNYGYDPTYCQYLGQAADGYQYELVRRPSMGAPPSPIPPPQPVPPPPSHHDLLMPTQYSQSRSGSLLVPSAAPVPHFSHHQHHPGLSSMQGSFDSVGGPPATPIFMQPASPRPPYHQPLQAHSYAGNAGPSYSSSTPHRFSSMGGVQPTNHPHDWGPPNAADIPKLIHETSI
jgi:hypothetical protein